MTRVAVLASGNGTTLQAIIDAFHASTDTPVTVALVVSNNSDAYALERARLAAIPALVVDHRGRSREAFDADLEAAIDAHHIDLICFAGFMRIVTPAFVQRFAGRILNTHPALLPAFGGKGMYGEHVHRAVLDAGETVTGCTVHIVDEVPDGGPIMGQIAVTVLEGDTPETLAARVQAAERRLYPDVIRWWALGRVELDRRRVILHPLPPVRSPETVQR